MNILLKHIENDMYKKLPFPLGKYTNATYFVYTALGSAIFYEADMLFIKKNYFLWMKDYKFIGQHFGKNAPMPIPSYIEVFKIIYSVDEIVQKYTDIDYESTDRLIVSLRQD